MSAAGPEQVRTALAAASRAGEFFRLGLPGEPGPAGWQPAGADLTGLVTDAARRLGTSEPRVAASILHLGLAARVWSPVVHCGLVSGVVPDLGVLLISAGPPARLAVGRLAGWTDFDQESGRAALAGLCAAAGTAALRQIQAGLPARLPAGLLRGNSASALAGSLAVLVRARPELAGRARDLAAALLRTPGLRGSGELSAAADSGLGFRRASCCLYYRVPGGGLCGDCCLDRVPG